jgi:hypothetical protein
MKIGSIIQVRDHHNLMCVSDYSEEDGVFLAYDVHPELWIDPNIGEPGYEPKLYVNDISEVVSVLEE